MKRLLLLTLLILTFKGYAQRDSTAINDSIKILALQKWKYQDDTDKMTSKLIHYAMVKAKEKVFLKFPYSGGSYATIALENEGDVNCFVFTISKGFIGDLGNKQVSALLRFDEEQPKQYGFYFDTGEKKDHIWLNDESTNEVIGKLKKAKRLRIELFFWQAGNQVMEFNVANLKWNYKENIVKPTVQIDQKWQYGQSTDKMTSDIAYKAEIVSSGNIGFQAPDAKAYLYIQNLAGVNYFFVGVTSGKFKKDIYNAANIRIRFDEDRPQYYVLHASSDNSYEMMGASHTMANQLIDRLKKAKRVLVEAEFNKEGDKIIEFDIPELKWEHKGAEDTIATSVKPTNTPATGGVKINVSSTVITNAPNNSNMDSIMATMKSNMNAGTSNSTSEIAVNGIVVDTKQDMDEPNQVVKLHCTCKNTNKDASSITIKASFMDDKGNILSTKSATLSCPGNSQSGTDLSATGIFDKYKSYRVEIQ